MIRDVRSAEGPASPPREGGLDRAASVTVLLAAASAERGSRLRAALAGEPGVMLAAPPLCTAAELAAALERHRPDVVILDAGLPGFSLRQLAAPAWPGERGGASC